MKASLALLWALPWALVPATAALAAAPGVDLSGIPPAHSVGEARDRLERIKPLVYAEQASMGLDAFSHNGLAFTNSALGRLALGRDVEAVNRAILDPSTWIYSKPGTDFHDVFFCNRTGDYDFALRGLVTIAYLYRDKPWLLYPETYQKIVHSLLNETGNGVRTRFSLGLCGWHSETENHILMTETSRYLTNQLLATEQRARGTVQWIYDNELNGMNEWMLRHLQQFFQHDFYELNSRPYQMFTVMALENLASFAEDERVRLAAEMLLNYLDAKFAVSSDNLRRYVPFRRQPSYRTRTDLLYIDGESQRMALMSGATELLGELATPWYLDTGGDPMMMAALSSYRTPDLILDLIVNREHARYFQAFHHKTVEIYAAEPSYLLTAGGIHDSVFDWFSDQMYSWALPTSLMPTHGELDASRFVRFMGQHKDKYRINTCVAPGFACGLNPSVPASIPASCYETQGGWKFFDFTRVECPLKYGFLAALYSSETGDDASFGFLEVREADLSFEDFKSRVLAANHGASYSSWQESEYVTTQGRRIRFVARPSSKTEWSIHSIDGNPMVTDINRWPLAFGDIMRSSGDGRIEIRNPVLGRKLVLDMTDPMHPSRQESSF